MAKLIVVDFNTGAFMFESSMPDATTMKYAAMRIAEEGGWDPLEGNLSLIGYEALMSGSDKVIGEGDIAKDWDGRRVVLYKKIERRGRGRREL